MTSDTIKKREQEGKLKKQKAGLVQVEGLLRQAIMDLKEAQKIHTLVQRATYIMAYMAMLKAGRALLLFHGYVPDDGAQHRTVVEITAEILGPKFKDITSHFEVMRRKRNEMTYEYGTLLSKSEMERAFTDAIQLVEGILKQVKEKNPQMELKFDLSEG